MGADDEGGVRSVLRAFDLLALFTERRRTWSVRDLTEASGLAKTTVLRLIATCEQRGLLWTGGDGRVTVGPGMLRWAQLANSAWQPSEPVRQVMRELSARCGETVNLYVRGTTARVCVAQQESSRHLRHIVRIGDELPLWCGAASRVLLAGAGDDLLRRVAAAAPDTTAETLKERASTALTDGFAVSHGERELGASAVAAPVLDPGGTVLAALTLGGPTARFTPDRVAEFVAAVTDAARRISRIGLNPVAWEQSG